MPQRRPHTRRRRRKECHLGLEFAVSRELAIALHLPSDPCPAAGVVVDHFPSKKKDAPRARRYRAGLIPSPPPRQSATRVNGQFAINGADNHVSIIDGFDVKLLELGR